MGDTSRGARGEEGPKWNPFLLIGRGLGWGAVGGAALGVVVTVPTVVLRALVTSPAGTGSIAGVIAFLLLVGVVAGVVGAAVGAALGLAGGLALALSGRHAVQQMFRARLITGTAAAALPLVLAHFSQAGLQPGGYAGAAVLAVMGACAAMLLTPLVVQGMPDRRDRPDRLPGAQPGARGPAAARGGGELSGTEAQEPRWVVVGRGMSWGVIGGAALGVLGGVVLRLGSDSFAVLAMVWLALGGAVLGAVLGFTGGLAAPLNAREDGPAGARLG